MSPKFLVNSLTIIALTALLPACKEKKSSTGKYDPPAPDSILSDIKLPDGFLISIFADDVTNARSMAIGEYGTIFVGTRKNDKVYALVDSNHDGRADKKYIIAEGLHMPNGVAFREGSLYVAEVDKVWRFDDIEQHLDNPPPKVLISNNFPDDDWHGWKYIAFGPDDKLYVPVGAPCNVCDKSTTDERYASITRMNPDGSDFEVYAHGIRNTVGFAWHPLTHDLWFTDNGRDNLGDDVPNDELNKADKKDMHFGFPYCHAGDVPDPEYGKGHACINYTPPVQKLAPHAAALGMKFYTGNMFPAKYRNQVFIAEHGSWNRTVPIGYRITLVKLDGNNAISYEPFAEGWLKEGVAWGRPVDILQLPDGSLLVSDDYSDRIYRITYKG